MKELLYVNKNKNNAKRMSVKYVGRVDPSPQILNLLANQDILNNQIIQHRRLRNRDLRQ